MASRGAAVAGTDGNDYSHRETIVQQYHVSARTKSRLMWVVVLHHLLGIAMTIKLLPDILDRMDVFVMELEQLFVPKPYLWEWGWDLSVIGATMAFSSCKKSRVFLMRLSQLWLMLFGVVPVVAGLVVHFPDAYSYVVQNNRTDVPMWQGYPVPVLWYGFCLAALQVHAIELHYANVLVRAWSPKRKTN